MASDRWPLRDAVSRLRKHYGAPDAPVATDPFDMVLWECCAYLVDDERRGRVYGRLKKATRNDATRIAAMKPGALAELLTEDGGMQPAMRAAKLQQAADVLLDVGAMELRAACKSGSKGVRAMLKRFPGVADPGADRILMTAGSLRTLAVESNGLRVLRRLGYGRDEKDYTRTYKVTMEAVAPELPDDRNWLVSAHRLLREHGQTLCKTTRPACGECPLLTRCPTGQTLGAH